MLNQIINAINKPDLHGKLVICNKQVSIFALIFSNLLSCQS